MKMTDLKQVTVLLASVCVLLLAAQQALAAKEYYYTRTRNHPQHLRISEGFKNRYVEDVKLETRVNNTRYEYYKSQLSMSHDELVYSTIDKMFQHRLSPFYVHTYDSVDDKRRSMDLSVVSHERCARDLMYLVDNLPNKRGASQAPRDPYTNNDEDHLSPELTALFDSYGRQEAGLMMGNTYWVGAYEQCVNRHIFELTSSHPAHARRAAMAARDDDAHVIDFKGRYCVSALKSSTWDAIIRDKKINSRAYFKSERQFNDYAKLFRLQVGICLPSSCDSTSIERHAHEIKLLTQAQLEPRYADYELVDLYCLPDETSDLRAWSGSALNFVAFMSLWCGMLLLATAADVLELVDTTSRKQQQQQQDKKRDSLLTRLVCMLSLRANYRKMMHVDESTTAQQTNTGNSHTQTSSQQQQQQQQVDRQQQQQPIELNLKFLNAFKALIMFWIINGHIMLLMIQTAKNILYSDALLNGLMHFLIGATFGVDLFFTMTGFLTAYLIFDSGHAFKMNPLKWVYLAFRRYWRLAPMYLISFWFSRSVAQMLGSGPLWDYGTSNMTFRGLCNTESWWYPVTLTSNLHGLFEECMITSWYISCDMQFFLVSPIFIHLLAKKPLHGWCAALAAIAMSLKVRYDAVLEGTSARHDELVQPRADIFMRVSHDLPALYTHPHYRVCAYIVGLLAGHYVYMLKSRKWTSILVDSMLQEQPATAATSEHKHNRPHAAGVRLRNLIAYAGVFMFGVMSFVSYLLSHYYPSSMLKYAKAVAGVAYALDHLVMAIGVSFIIVAMCFGQWSKFVRFLSHKNWTRLSKINYALLLLQCEAIYYQVFRYEQIPVAGTRELINILFNLLVTLYPLAFVVTLAFEFPLANLEKFLI